MSNQQQKQVRNLPCGCILSWDKDETTVVFCRLHTTDYIAWQGNDRDYIKRIATPSIKGKKQK